MRLFHVSEDGNILIFNPRIPTRKDIDNSKGLVWSINEEHLPNFLMPRNCPRVTYYSSGKTTEEDKKKYFSSKHSKHVVAIEHDWFEAMKSTTLYLYEFDTTDFYLQDECAGYYVSEDAEVPINKIVITNLFNELFERNVEVRLIDNLWDLRDEIVKSSLNWSMCRMGFAKERYKNN